MKALSVLMDCGTLLQLFHVDDPDALNKQMEGKEGWRPVQANECYLEVKDPEGRVQGIRMKKEAAEVLSAMLGFTGYANYEALTHAQRGTKRYFQERTEHPERFNDTPRFI